MNNNQLTLFNNSFRLDDLMYKIMNCLYIDKEDIENYYDRLSNSQKEPFVLGLIYYMHQYCKDNSFLSGFRVFYGMDLFELKSEILKRENSNNPITVHSEYFDTMVLNPSDFPIPDFIKVFKLNYSANTHSPVFILGDYEWNFSILNKLVERLLKQPQLKFNTIKRLYLT